MRFSSEIQRWSKRGIDERWRGKGKGSSNLRYVVRVEVTQNIKYCSDRTIGLDIVIAVRLDSACEETQRELHAIREMIFNETNYDKDDADMDEVELGHPLPEDDPDSGMETPTFSDSSDFEHEGNSVPCRYYNHGGCKKGKSCKFRHAPDNRSVRDDLYVVMLFCGATN